MDPRDPSSFNVQLTHVADIDLQYVDEGTGPVVICIHGFPDLWYGWRYQIRHLVSLGYRVIAPNVRGYGQTDATKDVKDYSLKNIVSDLVGLLDTLNIREAVWAGHDWGGSIAWRAALWHPERVIGVISFCTPYFLTRETYVPLEKVVDEFPELSYQLYFRRPGTADEINQDLSLFFNAVLCPANEFMKTPIFDPAVPVEQRSIRDVEKQKRSSLVTLGQLDYYVSEYQWNGIDGPLLFYHAHQLNWEEEREAGFLMSKIEKPCMMVTAGKDNALPAKWAAHMPDFIPDLMQEHIEDSGHWVLVEQPKLCNTAFSNYLQHLEDNGFVEK